MLPLQSARTGGFDSLALGEMRHLFKNRKKLLFVAGDIAAVLLANFLAVVLRFDFVWSNMTLKQHRNKELLLLDLVVTPVIFYATGLYQGYWKYAGLSDLLRLVRAVTYRTLGLIVVFYVLDMNGLSRAVVVMTTVFLLIFTGVLRLTPRFRFEFFSARHRSSGRRAIIVGAGDTGEALLRELKKDPGAAYNPIGFVDDDAEKLNVKIHGVPVLGNTRQLERIIEDFGVREVIIAIPGAAGEVVRNIFDICRHAGARFRTVPTRGEVLRGAARLNQIRLVDLEDLLGRDVVDLDQKSLRSSLSGCRVLVTGAAGSIGRELARQIAGYGPADLILLDRNENSLFYLEAELRAAHPLLGLTVAVGDILDRRRLTTLFEETRPQIVIHAAAYKHVPLMEQNPVEAVKNNVLGTRSLAEIAAAGRVERFIYVSTDKAVRPASVMGATKRLGERMVKSLTAEPTRFIAVRFGNVLGSDGSVVPTFRKQIAAGGPVTVTHPETSRYFMTIPEAVQLILLAGAMGEGGETYLLRMGEPVRILDLARNLIELSGLKVDEDIKIVFTGLRPGEKLHEELKNDAEDALATSNEKILVLTGVEPLSEAEWEAVAKLEEAALEGGTEETLAHLNLLVTEYTPEPAKSVRGAATASRIVDIGARKRVDAQA